MRIREKSLVGSRLHSAALTQQFVSQHAQLLSVQASLGDGGELPTQHLGQLTPTYRGRIHEERQILEERKEQTFERFYETESTPRYTEQEFWGVAYLGVRGQHVVPHDGGPTTWQLANVGDHHNRQRRRLAAEESHDLITGA